MKHNPPGYTPDGLSHYMHMCELILNKMMNPEIKECSFIESIYSEDWSRAKYVGDDRNKEALENNLYQEFVKYIKTSSEFITKNREDKLNFLI